MAGVGGRLARRDDGARSLRLFLFAGFFSQDGIDNRNVSVSEMSNVLMGQIDDISKLFVIAYRAIAVLVHVRFDSGDPRLIASKELAEVLFGLLRVAGTATWNEIAEPMLAQCLLVDWNDVIHDKFAFGAAVGAGMVKFFDDLLPLVRTELLVPETAQNVPHHVILRVANRIALVASSWGAGLGFALNLAHRSAWGRVNGLDTLLGKVSAKQREAFAGWRIEPLAGDSDADTIHSVLLAPIPDALRRADLRHGPTERIIDIEGLFRVARILKSDELGWVPFFAMLEYSRYAVLNEFPDLHVVPLMT